MINNDTATREEAVIAEDNPALMESGQRTIDAPAANSLDDYIRLLAKEKAKAEAENANGVRDLLTEALRSPLPPTRTDAPL